MKVRVLNWPELPDEWLDEPPSIHVYRETINGEEVWYCGCCAAPVPFDHICACERDEWETGDL